MLQKEVKLENQIRKTQIVGKLTALTQQCLGGLLFEEVRFTDCLKLLSRGA